LESADALSVTSTKTMPNRYKWRIPSKNSLEEFLVERIGSSSPPKTSGTTIQNIPSSAIWAMVH